MIVQIYEVRSPDEAAALAALGVDHIGILVGAGAFPREISPGQARAIFAAVPRPAKGVLLSLSADPAEIARTVRESRPSIVHLGAAIERLSPAVMQALKSEFPEIPLMRSIPIVDRGSLDIARSYLGVADFLLLDSHRPGDAQIGAQGLTHDWALSRRIVEKIAIPAILAGGLSPENVTAAIATVGPAGVDSKTLTDRADGRIKDLAKVRRFVESAKEGAVATRNRR